MYGAVPPLTETVADPFVFPKQLTFDCALIDALSVEAGCEIVTDAVAEQPLASVIVTTYEPAR